MSEPLAPECDKLRACRDRRLAIIEFLEWLRDNSLFIAQYRDIDYEPIMDHPIDQLMETDDNLMYRFLGIDKDKLEAERRAMLQAIRQGDQ